MASKIDSDCLDTLLTATLKYDGSAAKISYEGIVDAIDIFGEEINSVKVMFVNPAQVTTLRKDANFISADKYGVGMNVIMTGEIGRICNCAVVPSKKIAADSQTGAYVCPIVKLNNDAESEDDAAALTIYRKRSVNVETERQSLKRLTDISADEIYGCALSNASKVVLATFKK